jgi:hypothetical protein
MCSGKILKICLFLIVLSGTFFSNTYGAQQDSFADEEKAAGLIVEHALGIQGPVTVKKLHGGLSGIKLHIVTAGGNAYVVRSLAPPAQLERQEIACLQIASASGYGPHLYAVDPDRRYVIMQYIAPHVVSDEDKSSGLFFRALGEAMSKMHHGPNFPEQPSIFNEITSALHRLECLPVPKDMIHRMEVIFSAIKEPLSRHSTKAPCHNDLNPNNIIFTGREITIIDYEGSGQDAGSFD